MMRNNNVIAVTGGIGSGKSTFCALLQDKGFPVFSCDKIYAELLAEGRLNDSLRNAFPECFDEKGLNRRALAEAVFANERKLYALNEITHPEILRELFSRAEKFPFCFAEVPLLYEEGLENFFDGVIALRRNRKKRICAVKQRDGISEQEVEQRIARQFPEDRLEEKECFLLENDGTLSDLSKKADEAIQLLKNKFPFRF